MNSFFKIFSAFALTLGSATLMSCGDSSSSDVLSLDSSFEIILSKTNFSYNSKDSLIVFKKPVCKEGTLGNLVWKRESEERDSIKAYLNKSTITVNGTKKYTFKDSKFPYGLWMVPEYADNSFQNATRFTGDNVAEDVFRYDGNCFLKSFYSVFLKSNPALVEANSALSNFYKRFLSPKDLSAFDEKAMSNDIRATDCNELTMFDGLVKITIDEFRPYSGKLKVAYADKECPIDFSIRYSYNESDCQAAYADFKDSDAKEFRFDDFWKDEVYDEYCVEELILKMKKEQNIPLKKSAVDKNEAKQFASGVVEAVFFGIK
ncbi:MAG: hypothetical protein MJY82_06985 [Fibrobacter sp.]|nr:hypothetical protein [Fibrobacter sp.]